METSAEEKESTALQHWFPDAPVIAAQLLTGSNGAT
jgi:hypothetical protein